jgi:DNA-binding MarR family transcriptional regulator
MTMRINRGNHSVKAMAEAGLTLPQIGALHVLMFEGPTSVTTLTERLDLSLSATSHLVQRLVEAGLVSREEDPADRRQKVLSLTDAGRQTVEDLMQARRKEFRSSIEPLSPALRRDLHAVLTRIVAEMSAKAAATCPARPIDPNVDPNVDAVVDTDVSVDLSETNTPQTLRSKEET